MRKTHKKQITQTLMMLILTHLPHPSPKKRYGTKFICSLYIWFYFSPCFLNRFFNAFLLPNIHTSQTPLYYIVLCYVSNFLFHHSNIIRWEKMFFWSLFFSTFTICLPKLVFLATTTTAASTTATWSAVAYIQTVQMLTYDSSKCWHWLVYIKRWKRLRYGVTHCFKV